MTKKQKEVMAQYVGKLLEMRNWGDNEIVHGRADALLVEALRELGFGELADAYTTVEDEVGFWYA